MKSKHFIILSFLLQSVLSQQLYAQTATLRGKVINGDSGEPLLGATIRVIQDGNVKGGAYSDLEGDYTAKVPAGMYTLITSYISFNSDTLTGVSVSDGEVLVNNIILNSETQVREDLAVEIVAKRNQASDVAFYKQKLNAINAIDGVTFDLIQRTGDANVAAAMQRVVGVTVTEGKYVYVRGLGDRYSKTLLNGAQIPGLDPDRNTVQMDIFPSNLIDNVVVVKNFTPDLPADFSGGLINIITKDFPDRLTISASASAGYNPQANLLQNEFLTYETGKKDWLGFDDGTRAVPDVIQNVLAEDGKFPFAGSFTFDQDLANKIERVSEAFPTSLAPIRANSGLNQNYQFSIGNQYSVRGSKLGFIAGLSYRNDFNYYGDLVENRYYLSDSAATSLSSARLMDQGGYQGSQNVLWGALAKISYKTRNHKVSLNYMRNQSGNSSALSLSGYFVDSGQLPSDPTQREHWETRTLQYVERIINSYQLSGTSVIPTLGGLEINWLASYSPSQMQEPDLRFFTNGFEINSDGDSVFALAPSRHTLPGRFYRGLEEDFYNGGIDFKIPLKLKQGGEIKFGGNYTYTDRQYNETRYQYQQVGNVSYNGNITNYLSPTNLGIKDSTFVPSRQEYRYTFGLALIDGTLDVNSYEAEQTVAAGYLMGVIPVSARLKFIGGARYEYTDAYVQSADTVNFGPGTLRLNDVLPSLSAIYAASPNMNVRFAGYRTLARPSFREFSPLRTFGWVGDFEERGTPGLQRTLIDNFDVRWEWFPGLDELISVSFFYKHFTNPIEKSVVAASSNPYFQYRNVPEANVYGIELEFRKNFGFLGEGWEKIQLGGNASFIESRVDIDATEYQVILSTDPERPSTRPLFSQSPYAANGELAYIDQVKGMNASLSYNVFGPRLILVGVQGTPDVYEQPRQLVNFSISKRIGKYISIRLRANNLLNPDYKFEQSHIVRLRDAQGNPIRNEGGGFQTETQDYTFRSYSLGRSFSVGVSFKY
jgi:hypothetical protein